MTTLTSIRMSILSGQFCNLHEQRTAFDRATARAAATRSVMRNSMTTASTVQVRSRSGGWLRKRLTVTRTALAAILVIATVVRVVGSRWGLPMLLHPDEWAVVDGVIDMARRNSFEPPWLLRPDHVEMKLDYLAFAGYAQLFRGMSTEAAFALDPAPFYVIARLMTAAFGVGTVVLAYLIGRRLTPLVGLVAAGLFAIFPPFVRHAHFATPDVPLTFALMLMIYALMRYLATASWASLLTASFAVAMAIAIKYPGGIGALTIALVVVLAAVRDRSWLRILTHGVGSAAGVVGFLFLISPVLFTNISGVRAELEIQAAGDRFGMEDLGLGGNLWYYLSQYAHASGLLLLALALVGLIVVVRRREVETVTWLTGVMVWVALSTMSMHWERWGFPMYVTPMLLAAVGLATLIERFWSAKARWFPVTVAVAVFAQLLIGTAAVLAGLLAPDTRAPALAFAQERGIRADNSAFEGYSPFLPGHPAAIFDQVRKVDGNLQQLTEEGAPARYVVLSSSMYGRVLGKPGYESERQFYQRIFDDYTEIKDFVPTGPGQPSLWEPVAVVRNLRYIRAVAGGGMSGPQIRIFEVPISSR